MGNVWSCLPLSTLFLKILFPDGKKRMDIWSSSQKRVFKLMELLLLLLKFLVRRNTFKKSVLASVVY